MKQHLTHFFICSILVVAFCFCAACGSGAKGRDTPTRPETIPQDMENLYDFHFSERYDDRIRDDFSLLIPKEGTDAFHILFLLDTYQTKYRVAEAYAFSGDGLVPYVPKRYLTTFEDGNLMIGTDDYEADHVEYISYLWSDIEGVKTNKGVAVGSAETELLAAYQEGLCYMDKAEALSDLNMTALSILGYGEDQTLIESYDFDYAYFWQPFNPAENDVRDITFFIRDDTVSAIEMQNPLELRHVIKSGAPVAESRP